MTKKQLLAAATTYTSVRAAHELVNNILGWDAEDVIVPNVLWAIEHRIRHFGMKCLDPEAMALSIAAAYQYRIRQAWIESLQSEGLYVRRLS